MHRPAVRWAPLLVLLLVLAIPGCVARQMREAQNAFNGAARAENQQRASLLSGRSAKSALLDGSSAQTGYRVSLNLLDEELQHHEDKLRQEQLLGTALVLKALCLWRLADLEDVADDSPTVRELTTTLQRIRSEQTGTPPITLGTRDRVMVAAIDGLRDHDRGLRASDMATAKANFESSFAVLDKALTDQKPPPNHPVRVYIRISQLATLRAWQASLWKFEPDRTARLQGAREVHEKAKRVVAELEPATQTDPDLKQLVAFYKSAIGI